MRLTSLSIFAAYFLVVVTAAPLSRAADKWLQFRGPDGQGHAASDQFKVDFSMEKSVVWKTPIAGKGWSTPVVSDGLIWITTAITQEATAEESKRRLATIKLAGVKAVVASVELKAICVDFATGKILHDISLAKINEPEPVNPLNTFASPTAVIDGDSVYCHFGSYGTWCLDLTTGGEKWMRQLIVDHSVGPGSSPILVDNLLILVCDGTDKQFVAALDKQTGKEVWRTTRPEKRSQDGEYRKAYCTPVVVRVGDKPQLVIPTAQWVCGYEISSGKELWRIDHGSGFSMSSMPVVTDKGLVVFSTGYMKPEMVAVDPTGTGDVTKSHIAWRSSRGAPAKPSPISVDGNIYMVSDLGVLTQLDSATGDIRWQHRLGGNYSASPIQVGDKLIFCSHEGRVTVVKTGDTYEEVAKNELEPRLMASPVVVDEQLIMRTEFHLLRIGG